MICLICRQTEITDSFTAVFFERGEMRLAIKSVPARVCVGCGEAYVYEDVAVRLLQGAKKIFEAGILDDVIEYDHLP